MTETLKKLSSKERTENGVVYVITSYEVTEGKKKWKRVESKAKPGQEELITELNKTDKEKYSECSSETERIDFIAKKLGLGDSND